jgi:hypothetical protein
MSFIISETKYKRKQYEKHNIKEYLNDFNSKRLNANYDIS